MNIGNITYNSTGLFNLLSDGGSARSVELTRELVAARLNSLNGADDSLIVSSKTNSDELLTEFPPGTDPIPAANQTDFDNRIAELGGWNRGEFGDGLCPSSINDTTCLISPSNQTAPCYPGVPPSTGCTYSYPQWRDHSDWRWRVDLLIGDVTYNYSELAQLLKNSSTMLSIRLSKAQIAAKLSVLNGANPNAFQTLMNDADAYLITYPPGSDIPAGQPSDDGEQHYGSLIGVGDGIVGPGNCSQSPYNTTCLTTVNYTLPCGGTPVGTTTGSPTTGPVTTGLVTTGNPTTGAPAPPPPPPPATTGPVTTGAVSSTTTSTTSTTSISTTSSPTTSTTSTTGNSTTTVIDVEITTGNNNGGDNTISSTKNTNGDNSSSNTSLDRDTYILISTIGFVLMVSTCIVTLAFRVWKHRKDKNNPDKLTKEALEDVVHKVMINSATMSRVSGSGTPTPGDLEAGLSPDDPDLSFDDLMNNSFVDNPLDDPGDFHSVDSEEIDVKVETEEEGWTETDIAAGATEGNRRNTVYNIDTMFAVDLERE